MSRRRNKKISEEDYREIPLEPEANRKSELLKSRLNDTDFLEGANKLYQDIIHGFCC